MESFLRLGSEERLCFFSVWKFFRFLIGLMGFGFVSEGREGILGRVNRWIEIWRWDFEGYFGYVYVVFVVVGYVKRVDWRVLVSFFFNEFVFFSLFFR